MDFGIDQDPIIDTPYGDMRWSYLKMLIDGHNAKGENTQLEHDFVMVVKAMLTNPRWAIDFVKVKAFKMLFTVTINCSTIKI